MGLAVGAACASRGTPVPYCPPPAELAPPPTAACGADPAVQSLTADLQKKLGEDAGSALVRVTFGSDARVASVCSERGPGWKNAYTTRARLGRHLPELSALPAGPSCLAGARLDLNRYRAKLAEIHRVQEECRDRLAQGGLSAAARAMQARYCQEHEQKVRGEIWLEDGLRGTVVFVRTAKGSARETALRVCCSRGDAPEGSSSGVLPMDRRMCREDLPACMQEQGWELLR